MASVRQIKNHINKVLERTKSNNVTITGLRLTSQQVKALKKDFIINSELLGTQFIKK